MSRLRSALVLQARAQREQGYSRACLLAVAEGGELVRRVGPRVEVHAHPHQQRHLRWCRVDVRHEAYRVDLGGRVQEREEAGRRISCGDGAGSSD